MPTNFRVTNTNGCGPRGRRIAMIATSPLQKQAHRSAPKMLDLDPLVVGAAEARRSPKASGSDVLVLGLGDVHMSDEGVGVHVIHQLKHELPIPHVRFLDGGFGGAHLLAELDNARAIVVVCGTCDSLPAGTLSYAQPRHARDLPPTPGAALDGLKELFAAATLLDRLPEAHLYTVSIGRPGHVGSQLSSPIAAAMAVTACTVHGHAARLIARIASR
jgi:hydrogenase maturation protease